MILASKSPRRKEILESIGLNIEVITETVDESSNLDTVEDKIKEISLKKVISVANKNIDKYVVGADTVVEIDGEILGKPKNRDDAKNMLKRLSNRKHRVITAYTLMNIEKKIEITRAIVSYVVFRELSDVEIEWYLDTNEPFDKAGSYGIQGYGKIFVSKIEGDFYSIMGFPVQDFMVDLKNLGIDIKNIDKI